MTLIKSVSGIRGTIGGKPGEGLTPLDVVKYSAAFAQLIKEKDRKTTVVIGRDARPSGEAIAGIAAGTLRSCGINVIDLGLCTTPTVEMAVPAEKASGGIIITASHNPGPWNALKLVNSKGEFISEEKGNQLLTIAEKEDFEFVEFNMLGSYKKDDSYLQKHIDAVLNLPLVNTEAIKNRNFRIAIDCVNSIGGIAVPQLLRSLGVHEIGEYFCEPNGKFPHNPEPLPENLTQIVSEIEKGNYDLGIVVDPDVDRLMFICENGTFFGEEYTLVAVADYVLQHTKGNTVSNLSSTRALKDITLKHNGSYFTSPVGEVHVVSKMKENNAVIGGEGNGGIIYPELHYGRDALVGIALFLSHLAAFDKPASVLRKSYPEYYMSKNKIELTPDTDVNRVLKEIEKKYSEHEINTEDGLKIDFENEWVHLRKSNTEPIIRIYSESENSMSAEHLAGKIMTDIKEILAFKPENS